MANPLPPSSQTRVTTPGGNNAQIYVDEMPQIPQDVKDRFPSMAVYELALKEWVKNLRANLNVP
jgi:hypothetical protein